MKKLLIIDDDKAVVDVLYEALASDDRIIRMAYDGKTALNLIGKERFDLVICDLMMPKVHGFQILEWIRSNPELRRTGIIVLTAKSYKRDEDKARQAGASRFISKPFEISDIQEKVKEMLGD